MSTIYAATTYSGSTTSSPSGRSGMHKKRPQNCGSDILHPSENESLFASLPYDCYSLYAAVAEVLEGQPEERRWVRLHRGVLALVKDYESRAYFLRLFDILNRKVLWNEKMYKSFTVNSFQQCVNLLTFETESGRIFGLNFASPSEATKFKGHIDKRNEQERKIQQQKHLGEQGTIVSAPATAVPIGMSYGTRPTAMAPAAFNSNGVALPSSAVISAPPPEKDQRNFLGFKKKPKKENRKIRKEDISNPTNFEHRAHVGWDQDKGFKDIYSDQDHIDESVAEIMKAAGMKTDGIDRETIKFVYDFIDQYKKNNSTMGPPVASIQNLNPPMASVAQKIQAAPLNNWPTTPYLTPTATPPPPPRVASAQQGYGVTNTTIPPARPPPPPPLQGPKVIQTQQRPLPQVPPLNGSRPETGPPPPPPPPPMAAPGGAPPPPPPPPPPPGLFAANGGASTPAPQASSDPLRGLPSAQPNRGNLLAEIQAGKALRSVGATNTNATKTSSNDARGNVMEQIKAGAQLKHVDIDAEQEKRKSTQGVQDLGGIAGALARALAARRDRIDSDSDSDESEENNEWSDS